MTSPAARRIRPAVPHGMTSWLLLAAALFSLNAWALLSSFERMAVSLSILVFYLFSFLVGLLAVVWSGPLGRTVSGGRFDRLDLSPINKLSR